jgi:hypothetical protein
MTEEKLKLIYRIARFFIFLIPVFAVAAGLYLALFPVDSYYFYPDNPALSKFEIAKNAAKNQFSFGVFPMRNYRYIDLSMNLEDGTTKCLISQAEITAEKTYEAFTFPAADPINDENQLRQLLFESNKTKYPNGSLLHLKTTNEVFLISRGKKILFPGPEIFQAFGYSFDHLTEVEQSDIDQFPDAGQRVFLWTMAHPDGTIFQAFPSHSFYLIFDGKKMPIEDEKILASAWPGFFAIPVSDFSENNLEKCKNAASGNKVYCRFDSNNLPSIGQYYLFSVNFPKECKLEALQAGKSRIRFFSERSTETMKESARNIAASVLNRYFYKQ